MLISVWLVSWFIRVLRDSHNTLQYRHLIPAPVDRTSVSAWLYKHPGTTCQRNIPINDPWSLQIKATFSCEGIHAFMPRKRVRNRTCGHVHIWCRNYMSVLYHCLWTWDDCYWLLGCSPSIITNSTCRTNQSSINLEPQIPSPGVCTSLILSLREESKCGFCVSPFMPVAPTTLRLIKKYFVHRSIFWKVFKGKHVDLILINNSPSNILWNNA